MITVYKKIYELKFEKQICEWKYIGNVANRFDLIPYRQRCAVFETKTVFQEKGECISCCLCLCLCPHRLHLQKILILHHPIFILKQFNSFGQNMKPTWVVSAIFIVPFIFVSCYFVFRVIAVGQFCGGLNENKLSCDYFFSMFRRTKMPPKVPFKPPVSYFAIE